MSESAQYKSLLACFDKLVVALKQDPVTVWNGLASLYLIPPPDVQLPGGFEAQVLARHILNIVKVEPTRYDDVMKVLSKHDWLRDIVKILHTAYEKHIIENKRTMAGAPKVVKLLSRGGAESIHTDEIPQLSQWDFPHTPSSLPIPNPIVNLGNLSEDDYENLDAQISDLTVNINKSFKKLQNQVYESFRQRIYHSSIILTLTQDDVMIFNNDLDICGARDMFEVFMKAVYPHCSYFNYELLELLVDVHGSPEDKARMDEYLRSFTRYCEAMPCAEEICGNGGSDSRRVKLKFKIDLDRQRLKPEILRRVKYNIAHHLKIQPCSLYLRSVKEGCVLLEFLIPPFILNRVFPLSDAQKDALHNECKVTAIQCDNPQIHLVLGVSKQDTPPPPITKPLTGEQLNQLKKSVLLEKIGYLCEELGDPGRYFPELRNKNVLATVDTQLIKSKPTDREKIEEFVTLISTRRSSHGQHGLDVFIEVLKKQRVHVHVARTLLRTFNKKKVVAERTSAYSGGRSTSSEKVETGNLLAPLSNVDDGYSTGKLSTFASSNVSTASSGVDYHPEHGALPPSPPPTSTQEDNTPHEPDGNIHPNYGLLPYPPSPIMITQRETSYSPSLPFSLSADMDKAVNQPKVGTPPIEYSIEAELDTLRRAFENLKFEKKQLEIKYEEARHRVHLLESENRRLQEQIINFHHQPRPTNLPFHRPSHYYSSHGPDSRSVTPPTGQGAQSATEIFPPSSSATNRESVEEKDVLPRNSESADGSSSIGAQKSHDWKQLL